MKSHGLSVDFNWCGMLTTGWWLVASALLTGPVPSGAEATNSLQAMFRDPPLEYSSAPLWVWNDRLTEDQIRSTMRDLAGQRVRQVFVHPRPGLMTPYLSEEWFALWRVALDEAERLNMNVWIYDENSYPSGFAGGWVPETMPESRGRGLVIRESATPPPADTEGLVAVYALGRDGFENVTARLQTNAAWPAGPYQVARVQRAGNSPWHGGRCYVDLLYPGVTETFLDLTLGAYQKQVGSHFGKRIPGVFTDEPNIRPAGGLPWTDHLPEAFRERWRYDLLEVLPSLVQETGDWRKVRHNYFQLLLEEFINHWAKPYREYCQELGLEWTGHYWDHEWPHCLGVPDNMALYAWHQRPAIDTLMNQYREDTHAQFGNVRVVKELSSVANQMGAHRTLCELYGAGGWDMRFVDLKRIADWLLVLGVNTMDQHLSYITLRGARKRDHPLSFSYHEPWWGAYHLSATYLERLSMALSQGRQLNSVLVLEPTSTVWMYQNEAQNNPRMAEIGHAFQKLLVDLEWAQLEYDLGCEDIMARHGSLNETVLRVGQRPYRTVVIPPHTENLNHRTAQLLQSYLAGGGTVYCLGQPPERIDGAVSSWGADLARRPNWKNISFPELMMILLKDQAASGLAINRAPGDQGILFHHRRQLEEKQGTLLFLVNTSMQAPSSGTVRCRAKGVEEWDASSGKIHPYAFEREDEWLACAYSLPPAGSLLLRFTPQPLDPPRIVPARTNAILASAAPDIRRVEPNVLVLDYVDVTAGGETLTNVYFYQASQFAFQKNGMPQNPWDSAVQFGDELIQRTFPAESGFSATYRFQIQDQVPTNLAIVIERPDLYTIHCNGHPVSAQPGQWWLDKAFGVLPLAGTARPGRNEVTLQAAPFTIYHELEPAYLLGAFFLRPTEAGFVVAPEDEIHLGHWHDHGHPFYAAGVVYQEQFELPERSGRYLLSVPDWSGSIAEVKVNGQAAGYLAYPPWQLEITSWLKDGVNTVDLQVMGTLKNTLGPHHGNPSLGTAWPAMFHQGPAHGPPPGRQYHTVGYGLFGPFVLKHVTQ